MRIAAVGMALIGVALAPACAKDKSAKEKPESAPTGKIPPADDAAVVKANAAPAASDAGVSKNQALADKVRALSAGMPDMYGPSISVPPQWQQCKAASDCELVYSGCGIQNTAVNKASVEKTEAKWKKACERVKRGLVSALMAKSTVECQSNRCVERSSTAGLDEALENFGGVEGLSGRIGKGGAGPVGRRPSNPAPSIAVTRPRVKGSLDPSIVRRVVRSRQRQWLYCYQSAQARSGGAPKSARVEVSIEIDARGKTAKASVSGDGGKRLDDCMAQKARRWRYPAPKKGDVNHVTLKVKFSPAPKPANTDGAGVGDKGSP